MTPFDIETRALPIGDGKYLANLSPRWWVQQGPNGGYIAAIVLRAFTAAVDDDARTPRSLTLHYLRPAVEGEAVVEVTIERSGRSLTTLSGRLMQGDRLIALAIGAFSLARPGNDFCDLVMPQVPGPSHYAVPKIPEHAIPIARRWDTRWAIGRPPMQGDAASSKAVAGGWIRLPERQPIDAVVAAAITDGWLPPIFSKVDAALAVPTVDLTIHFRSSLPHPGLADDDFVLAVFRTNVIADGFLEEDGEIWAPDGTLIAQSRQLAVVLPLN